MRRRLLGLIGSLGAILLLYFAAVRPWYLHWGATSAEVARPLPGDQILPNAAAYSTRAITIEAPVERVWPWLAQLGQDRGGFYSYDLLENLVGCEMPTQDRLRPERQSWRLGDKLWMYPPSKAGGMGFGTLRTYLPGRALAFGTRTVGAPLSAPEDGSWAFVLEPAAGATRLLVRGRGTPGRSLLTKAFDRAVFEPVHFVMERRMMLGLKQVAETGRRSRTANHLQIGLWVITFGLLCWSAYLVLRGPHWRRPLTSFVAACVAFQVLTLVQPGLLLGPLLVTGVAALLSPATRLRPLPRAFRERPGIEGYAQQSG